MKDIVVPKGVKWKKAYVRAAKMKRSSKKICIVCDTLEHLWTNGICCKCNPKFKEIQYQYDEDSNREKYMISLIYEAERRVRKEGRTAHADKLREKGLGLDKVEDDRIQAKYAVRQAERDIVDKRDLEEYLGSIQKHRDAQVGLSPNDPIYIQHEYAIDHIDNMANDRHEFGPEKDYYDYDLELDGPDGY